MGFKEDFAAEEKAGAWSNLFFCMAYTKRVNREAHVAIFIDRQDVAFMFDV